MRNTQSSRPIPREIPAPDSTDAKLVIALPPTVACQATAPPSGVRRKAAASRKG